MNFPDPEVLARVARISQKWNMGHAVTTGMRFHIVGRQGVWTVVGYAADGNLIFAEWLGEPPWDGPAEVIDESLIARQESLGEHLYW